MTMYRPVGDSNYRNINPGRKGTEETLAEMTRLIKEGATDPLIVEETRNVISHIPENSYKREVDAIFSFVKNRVRYTKDVVGVETISSPHRMMEEIKEKGNTFGDCDDHVVILGAMLESVGHPVRLVVTSQNPTGHFEHVYLEVNVNGSWIILDPTKKVGGGMGWEQPYYTQKAKYENRLYNVGQDGSGKGLIVPIAIIGILIYFMKDFLREKVKNAIQEIL